MARRQGHALLHAALGALVFFLLALVFLLEDIMPAIETPVASETSQSDQSS